MNREILKELTKATHDPSAIDRLIVSIFIYHQHLKSIKNSCVRDLIITAKDSDYPTYLDLRNKIIISSLEDLIITFEFVISPADKIVNGAVYTPEAIRSFIVNKIMAATFTTGPQTICDMACGCAGFLLTACELLHKQRKISYYDIFKNHLFGVDIKKYAVTRAKILLTLAAICNGEDNKTFEFNIFAGNALNFNWEMHAKINQFDIILGNPPYVCSRHLDQDTLTLLKKFKTCSCGHPDLYIPFFELGLTHLKENGFLGVITMNSFFKSVNGRSLREFLNNGRYAITIIDFGDTAIFNSKSTYTCICIIQKKAAEDIAYCRVKQISDLARELPIIFPQVWIDNHSGWNLNFPQILSKIEQVGSSLGALFKTSNGIATLKNEVYIFSSQNESDTTYTLRSIDEQNFEIEKNICVRIINPNKITSGVTLESLYQYIIFPYKIISDRVEIIPEMELKKTFPLTYAYLCSQRKKLSLRDKGKGDYSEWYAFGRNQGLTNTGAKLFFPHIVNSSPHSILSFQKNLLFYNGLAAISSDQDMLLYLQKVMKSKLFWFYIINSSKPYSNGHYSLSRNYIKNFGIPPMPMGQHEEIIALPQADFESWLISHYDLLPQEYQLIHG